MLDRKLVAGLALGFAVAAVATIAPVARATEDSRSGAFAAAVAKVLARKELDGAVVGLDVRSLTNGQRVYSRNAERAFTPASNFKLVTLYLALSQLGPGFEFETPLVADGPLADGGRLDGDLWVEGRGDPTLQPFFFESEEGGAALQPFVQALALQGVKRVRGDLVVDGRAFDDVLVPPGWPADQLGEEYAAPVGALSLNGNVMRVRVASHGDGAPSAVLDPEVFGWRVRDDLTSSARANECAVAVAPADASGVVRVRGQVGPEVATTLKAPVADPVLHFGLALRAAMEKAGIAIAGRVRKPDVDERLHDKSRVLYTRRSPLLPALQWCGKESDNNVAEHVMKACAFVRFGKGSYENGARLVQQLARDLGVDATEVVVADGSGLSRKDLVTPALLCALLTQAYQAPWRDEFVRCLPISGVDGTLEKRMAEPAMQYRVRAKTGFIAQVSALSGYAFSGDADSSDPAGHEVFAFSILVNGFKVSNLEMKHVQDDLCRAIVALPRLR